MLGDPLSKDVGGDGLAAVEAFILAHVAEVGAEEADGFGAVFFGDV